MNTYRLAIGSALLAGTAFLATAARGQQTATAPGAGAGDIGPVAYPTVPPLVGTTTPATARPSTKPDPTIQKIVGEISQEKVTAILKKLESFGTRNTMSDPNKPDTGIGAARQWILDQFKSYSPKLQVSFDTHQIPRSNRVTQETELRNVVAILPGKSEVDKNRWIMISGHYDTVNLRASVGTPAQRNDAPAPGVCDDGSGTACVMECARVLSQYDFDATLVFVAFAGEEQGLVGAAAMAKRLKSQRQEITAVLNNDIIGTEIRGSGEKDDKRVLVFSEDPEDSPSRAIARFFRSTAQKYDPDFAADMVFRYDRFARGGDHTAFNVEGYTAIRVTTPAEDFTFQHTANDTLANMSPAYTTRVIRLNAASAAALALAPKAPITAAPTGGGRAAAGAPGGGRAAASAPAGGGGAGGGRAGGAATGRVGLSRGTGYEAVMRWDYPNPPADLAGYVVVVRSTLCPEWQKEIWAGNVKTFTLKDMPIDQVVIGIKAVDKDGHEGPASAYINPPRAAAADAAAGAPADGGGN